MTLALIFAAFGFAGPRAWAQLPCRYDYVTWPTMDCGFGPFPGTPVAVNVHGHVTGWFIWCGEPEYRTFLWTGGPTTTILPLPPGYKAMRAESMNDLGEIVGALQLPSGTPNPFRAFLRRANGQVIDLGLPPGATMAWATAINNKSEITGYGSGPNGGRAFLWKDGSFTSLDLPVGPNSRGLAINDSTQITGWMGNWPITSVGLVWHKGQVTPFDPLPSGSTVDGRAISANGRVGGNSTFENDTVLRAVLWENGTLTNLGTLPGHTSSRVRAINDSMVVGTCDHENGAAAFIWSDGQMKKLSDLIPIAGLIIDEVGGITADGRIACWGYGTGGPPLGLLLTPMMPSTADITHDCRVNVNDLLLVINDWGKSKSPADINNDGIVNSFDLVIVIENWGQSS